MSAPPAPTPGLARLAAETAPAVLLFALLLWGVRAVLSPLVAFPLVVFALWPTRHHPLGLRALLVAAFAFAAWFVAEVQGVLTPFVVALAVAYLLAPAVDRIERLRVPRAAATIVVLVPFLAALVLLVLLLVPQLERQLLDFAARVPELAHRLFTWGMRLRERLLAGGAGDLLTDEQLRRLENLAPADIVQLFNDRWQAILSYLWRALLGIGRGIGSGLNLMLTVLGYAVVAPVVTFYLLRSWGSLTAGIRNLVPPAHRSELFDFLAEYDLALGRFARGQLTEAAIVAVLTGGALTLLGFPGAILVGVVAGVFNLIPVIGLPISLVPGVLFALAAPAVGTALLELLAVFAVVQFIDNSVTGPRIVGGSVGLNPVWVMVAVLIFGSLLGFVGMLLAVPLAVLVRMLAARAVARYRASPLYAAGPAP